MRGVLHATSEDAVVEAGHRPDSMHYIGDTLCPRHSANTGDVHPPNQPPVTYWAGRRFRGRLPSLVAYAAGPEPMGKVAFALALEEASYADMVQTIALTDLPVKQLPETAACGQHDEKDRVCGSVESSEIPPHFSRLTTTRPFHALQGRRSLDLL